MRCHYALVQVLPVRQIISCLVCWCCFENCLRRLFCSSGVSTWTAVVHHVLCDLADKAEEHDVNFHGYADDSQLYVHCRPEEAAATSEKLERCITDMDYWMSANRLRLNMDKAELLWTGTRYHVSTLNDSSPSLQLNNFTVDASQHVRV